MRHFLIGVAVAVPIVALGVWFAVAHWQIALAGGALLAVILGAVVAVVIAAIPIGYVVAAIYYATRPEERSACTSYSMDQGREAGGPDRGDSGT